MSQEIMTVDLHCHPNLKSFNSGHPDPKKDMWENIEHNIGGGFAKTISERSAHVLKESQANLYTLMKGNTRVFNISLYPIERGFLHLRNVPQLLIGRNRINVMHEVITGFDAGRLTYLKKQKDYFQELQDEYKYVHQSQGKSPDGKLKFVLVNSYKELEEQLEKDNTLIGIMSIEGGHVLGAADDKAETMTADELTQLLTENIQTIKNWENPPFTINLGHHFWNGLCGHASSFKPPINSVVNQNKGKDRGITAHGWHVLRELLGTHNGKRILIDTKHMSIASRKEYYHFVEMHNYVNPKDTIPIICSHGGANGFATMDGSIKDNDVAAKARPHRLYKWSINLSNEEIQIIHRSKGLVGLMMDRGMLGGLDTVAKIVEGQDADKKRKEYCKLFLDNALQMVKAVGDKSGWDVPAMGSDFDGTITHMEPYESSAKFPAFQQDLIAYLEETEYNKELWYGYTPKQIIEKIFYKNAMAFYKKFFV